MPEALTPTLIVAALIVLNGLFVAAEFAIVGAPRPAIARLAEQGHRRARFVHGILNDARQQDRFIATAQLGITLASIGLGMYGEHLLAEWLAGFFESLGAARWIAAHTLGSIVAIAVLTYFHIVIGEMVPKSLALQKAQVMVLWIAPVMRVIQLAMYPLVVGLNGLGNGLLRLFGIRRDAHGAEHYRTPEELTYLVHEAREGGLLRSVPARVVNELLDFGNLTAGQVMVPRVSVNGIALGASAADIQTALREHPHSRYPVYEESLDHITGMIHVKDVLRLEVGPEGLRQDQVRRVPFVPEALPVDQVINAMRQAQAQMAVVLDEHGGTAGILTSEDLFKEVVGDYAAEDVARIRPGENGAIIVAGVARLEAVGDALGTSLQHEDVDTVGGLVLSTLGHPPRVGDTVSWEGLRFEVLSVTRHGVAEASVRKAGR